MEARRGRECGSEQREAKREREERGGEGRNPFCGHVHGASELGRGKEGQSGARPLPFFLLPLAPSLSRSPPIPKMASSRAAFGLVAQVNSDHNPPYAQPSSHGSNSTASYSSNPYRGATQRPSHKVCPRPFLLLANPGLLTATLPQVKLCCVGDGGVGKTCLLIVYSENRFPTVRPGRRKKGMKGWQS